MTSAEIVNELRAARPTAPPSLRDRIEAIVAAPPAPRPSLAERLVPRRRALLVALPAAAVVAVASAGVIGVAGSGDTPDGTLATRETAPSVSTDYGSGETGAESLSKAADAATPAAPGPTTGRAQRVSANLTIEVADTDALSDATQDALRTTRSLGGYVVSVSYATGTDGTASLTVRVPTAKVQDAITRLSALGTIVAQQVQIDDLQESIDALDRRITGLRERIARLTARLDGETLTDEERAVLQARRAAARAELATLRGDRAGQAAEARLATIQLTLVTDSAAAVPAPSSRLDRALDDALAILAWEAAVAFFALVLIGPLLVAGLAAWLARKALQRREDERLLAS